MTIDEFATITLRIMREDGFANHLPTVCFPHRRHIAVLDVAPGQSVPEEHVLQWAASRAEENEEYLVAFKIDEKRFEIRRTTPDGEERQVFFGPTA